MIITTTKTNIISTDIEVEIPCYRKSILTEYCVFSEKECLVVSNGYFIGIQIMPYKHAFSEHTIESTKEDFQKEYFKVLKLINKNI